MLGVELQRLHVIRKNDVGMRKPRINCPVNLVKSQDSSAFLELAELAHNLDNRRPVCTIQFAVSYSDRFENDSKVRLGQMDQRIADTQKFS